MKIEEFLEFKPSQLAAAAISAAMIAVEQKPGQVSEASFSDNLDCILFLK